MARTAPFTPLDFALHRPFGYADVLTCPTAKRNKYGAVKTEVNGIVFDSKREAARYGELKLLERAKYIRQLELQPEYPFVLDGVVMFKYRGDFRYFEGAECVVEDVKGVKTDVYRLKKKLIERQYKIRIREVA